MASRLVLYTDSYWISPYVFSAYVALREKGLPFATKDVALENGDQHRPEYRDRSLTARVPALEHDGFMLSESSAIVEYIDEAFTGPAVLPTDHKERARARQVMAWVRSDLLALRDERPTTTMFYERAQQPLSDAGKAAAEKLVRVADALIVDGRATLSESGFSMADADLAFMLHRLILNDHPVPAKVKTYAEAHWRRPSVVAFLERERTTFVSPLS